MPAVTVSNYLRRLGEPSFVEDPNTGLKRLTRRYIVDTEGVEIANLESQVFDTIGNTDREYTDHYLIEQRIDTSDTEGDVILTRVFQQLDSGSGLVKSGGDEIERLENDLYRVTQTFIGLNGSADDVGSLDGDVGTDTYVIPNLSPAVTVVLASWKREVISDTVVRYTKIYQQKGIIRVDINERYGKTPFDKTDAASTPTLIEYAVTGFLIDDSDVTAALLGDPYNDGTSKPPGPFDVSTNNYHGMEVVRLRYVYGMGIIAASKSVKAGTAAGVVEHVLTSINVTPSEWLKDGGSLTYDSTLYNAAWLEGVGLNSISTDVQDDYILYTARYIAVDGAAGYVGGSATGGTVTTGAITIEGEWSGFSIPADSILTDTTTLEYGGNVEVRRISFIVELTSGTGELDNLIGGVVTVSGEENYVVVGSGVQVYPGYAVGEFTISRGSGVVSVTRDSRFADIRPGEDGGVVHQVTAINVNPTQAGAFDQGGRTYDFTDAKVISSTVKDTIHGPLYTMEIYAGSAITGLTTNFKYDGQLEITTITGLNINPLDVYGTQYGTVATHEVTVNQYGTLYKYVFAKGEGEILRKTESRYDQQVTVTTVKSLNIQPEVPANAYLISTQIDSDDYGDIYTYVWAEGSGVISVETESRYNNALTITTVRTINETFPVPEGAYLLSTKFEEGNYGEVWTVRYAVGSGLISTNTVGRYLDETGTPKLTITTVQYLNTMPPDVTGAYVISTGTETSDYGVIYTQKYAVGAGELETKQETRYNGTLTLYTTIWLNEIPVVPGGFNIVSTKSESAEYGQLYTYQYTDGSLPIELARSTRTLYNGQLTVTKIETLNQPAEVPDGAVVVAESATDGQYGTVYTVEYAEGSGQIDTKTEGRYNDENGNPTLTIITERWLNINPTAPDGATVLNQELEQGTYGELYTIRYATGAGKLFESAEERYDGKLKIYTSRWLNMEATDIPAGAAVISTQTETSDYGVIYTYRYAVGAPGFLEESASYRYDGDLKITTRTYLNQLPPDPGADDVLVEFSQEDTQYGTIYKQVVASGSGEVSRNESDIYPGILSRVTVRSLNRVPAVPTNAVVVSTETEDGTYGTFHTLTYAEGPGGMIDDATESRFNGALTLTTERWIRKTPVVGERAIVSSSTQSTQYGDVVTYQFAAGQGLISELIESRFGGTMQIYTWVLLNSAPVIDPATDSLLSYSTEEGSYGTTYRIRFARGVGRISIDSVTRFNGTLTITTERYLNVEGTIPASAYGISTSVKSEDYGTVYEYVYATGSGELSRSTSSRFFSTQTGTNLLEVLEVKSLNVPPATPAGYILAKSSSALESYGTVYTYEFAQGEGVLSLSTATKLSDSNGSPVVTTTVVRSLNTLPTATDLGLSADAVLTGTRDDTGEYGTTYTQTFVDGKGWLSTSEAFPYPDNPDIIIYTIRHANEEPPPPAGVASPRLIGIDVNDGSDITLYTARYVVGSGLIGESTSSRFNNTVTVNTYRFLAEIDTSVIVGEITREEIDAGQYGDIYTVRSVELVPPYITSERTTQIMPGVFRHEVTALIELPTDYAGTAGGTVTRTETRTSDTELGTQYDVVFIEAVDGTEVSTSTNQRPNGGETVTKIVVGSIDDPPLPSNTYLTSLTQEQRTGYVLSTYQYFTPPSNYSLSAQRTITYPGFVQSSNNTIHGYEITRSPSMETVTATIDVDFTSRPQGAVDNRELLSPTAIVTVNVVGNTQGVDPSGVGTKYLSNYWASNTTDFFNSSNPTNEGYRVTGSARVSGTDSQAGKSLILYRNVELFVVAGGERVYKVTTETIRL